MKSLIKFEDTYGLCDIYCALINIEYLDITKLEDKNFINIDKDTFISIGAGSSWYKTSKEDARKIIGNNIDTVIIVYDLDNEDGIKTKILSDSKIKSSYSNLTTRIHQLNKNYNINIKYIPVTWAAETILLYQYLSTGDTSLENIISTVDTNMLHLHLLGYLAEIKGLHRVKKIRNYLDITKLLQQLNKRISKENLNYNLSSILQSKFDILKAFDIEQALKHRNEAERVFNTGMKLNKGGHITVIKSSGEKVVIPYDATKQQLEKLLPFRKEV